MDFESKLQIHDSDVEGRGLFTRADLPANTRLFKLEGAETAHAYSADFSDEVPNWIGIGYQRWIMPEEGSKTIFLNHCCEPNVLIDAEQYVVSIREIKAGEELLLDYSSTELDPFWNMICDCGVGSCRKLVLSYQMLPYELQVKYKPYISEEYWRRAELERLT